MIPSCASPPSGQAIATFGLAVNRRFQRNGQWEEQTSLLQRDLLGSDGRERVASRCRRAPVSSSPAASTSGRGRPRTARSARRSRSIADEIGPSLRWATCRDHQERPPRARRRRQRWRRPVANAAPAAGPSLRTTRNPSDGEESTPHARTRTTRAGRKKKTSVLVQESVEYIDYKDINLLRRFMSDRAKIRARRVTGNDAQQQREVARAIKNAARWRCCRTRTGSRRSARPATAAQVGRGGPMARRRVPQARRRRQVATASATTLPELDDRLAATRRARVDDGAEPSDDES